MRDFALSPELEELQGAATRLATEELAPRVRESEAAGRWPDHVLDILDGFPLGDLDLSGDLGGAEAGLLAKVVMLEALAEADASGLYAADRPGPAAGAVTMCPDRDLAMTVLEDCRTRAATCAFTVVDPELAWPELAWGPGWPDLKWIWVSEADQLRLLEVTDTPTDVVALAFQASGGVGVPFESTVERGSWTLASHQAIEVRARARLWGAAIMVGIGQAAIDETIEYTTDRVVFGKPVAHHQANAFDLAAAAAGVHGARLVVRDAAASFDRGEPHAAFWATQAWLESVDAAFDATNLGIQLLGGHGFIVDHLAEKRFREARHLAMAAGARDAADADVAAQVAEVDDLLGSLGSAPGGVR